MTRVLHIDTDPQFATLVKRVLKTADNDLDVTSVSDQDKVWPALHRDVEYDCIVSGYQMGTIDGIELVRSSGENALIRPSSFTLGTGAKSKNQHSRLASRSTSRKRWV